MRQELDDKLCKLFPDIFRDRDANMRTSLMGFGFSHGDGWYDLLFVLCSHLEFLRQATGVSVVATQIKEKFGTLSFYYGVDNTKIKEDVDSDLVFNIIRNTVSYVELKSGRICEECGENGKTRPGSWVKTLCDKCDLKDKK